MRNIYILLISVFLLSCAHKRINEQYDFGRSQLFNKYRDAIQRIENEAKDLYVDEGKELYSLSDKIMNDYSTCIKRSPVKNCQKKYTDDISYPLGTTYKMASDQAMMLADFCAGEERRAGVIASLQKKPIKNEFIERLVCYEAKIKEAHNATVISKKNEIIDDMIAERNQLLNKNERDREFAINHEKAQWSAALQSINTQMQFNQIQQNQRTMINQNQQMLNNQNQGGQRSKINQPNY